MQETSYFVCTRHQDESCPTVSRRMAEILVRMMEMAGYVGELLPSLGTDHPEVQTQRRRTVECLIADLRFLIGEYRDADPDPCDLRKRPTQVMISHTQLDAELLQAMVASNEEIRTALQRLARNLT